MPDDGQNRRTLRLAATGASLVLPAILIFIATWAGAGGTVLQPNVPPLPAQEFRQAANAYPGVALWSFAGDTLFILSYLAMFVGLYGVTAGRARILPGLGLAAGLLAGLLDGVENAFFITYAALAVQGQPLTTPALPLLYVVGELKYTAIFTAAFAFGLALLPLWTPRPAGDSGSRSPLLEWGVALLLLLLPFVGALSIADPTITMVVVVLRLASVLLLGLYFWWRAGRLS